jgi:hypothetical protein
VVGVPANSVGKSCDFGKYIAPVAPVGNQVVFSKKALLHKEDLPVPVCLVKSPQSGCKIRGRRN